MNWMVTDWQEQEAVDLAGVRVTLPRAKLMQLVFEAGDRPGWLNLALDSSDIPSAALRSVILYCLARNICSSEEIVESAATDPAVCYLCANHPLEWPVVHEFRRRNLTVIQESLGHLFRGIARFAGCERFGWNEAQTRLRRAIQADSIVLDL